MLNYATISNHIGISQPTVKKWISLLETSGIIFLLQPHHKNFKKRLVKTPKLYFIDTGLMLFLLSIRTIDELMNHPLIGNIFETFIISEFHKRSYHMGERPELYFWRDKSGNEIDLIADIGTNTLPVEIKFSKTYNKTMTTNIMSWLNLMNNSSEKGIVIYRGDSVFGKNSSVPVVPWWDII